MDEFDLTRRAYEEPPADTGVRERARAQLDEAILREKGATFGRRRRRRRRNGMILPAASAAAILGVALTIALVAPFGGGSAAAAELRRLGAIAAEANQLQPAPGEFLLVENQELRREAYSSGVTGEGFTVLSRLDINTWIAADGSGIRRTEVLSSDFAGPADEASWEAAGRPEIPRAGDLRIERFEANEPVLFDLGELSTEPDELMDSLRSGSVVSRAPVDDAEVFDLIGQILAQGDASPELRSALFEVAARLDGVELIGEVTDPIGREGVGLAINGSDRRVQLVFDPETSHLLAKERYPILDGSVGDLDSWRAAEPAAIVENSPEG